MFRASGIKFRHEGRVWLQPDRVRTSRDARPKVSTPSKMAHVAIYSPFSEQAAHSSKWERALQICRENRGELDRLHTYLHHGFYVSVEYHTVPESFLRDVENYEQWPPQA